jgi:hypothetical protein
MNCLMMLGACVPASAVGLLVINNEDGNNHHFKVS